MTPLPKIAALIMILFLLVGSSAQAQPVEEEFYTTYLPVVMKLDPPRFIGPDGGNLTALAIDPQNPSIMYAGTWGAGVFKSTNGGLTWRITNTGLGNLYINSLAVSPSSRSVLYAGTYKTGQVFKSTDAGGSWFSASAGIQAEAVIYSIAVDAYDPNRVYIATRGISNAGGAPWKGIVYKSSDGGGSWRAVLENVGGDEQQDWAYSLFVSPVNTSLVMAAFHEYGPYISRTYGESWVGYPDLDKIDPSGRAIAADPTSPEPTIFFGAYHGGGVYRSDNLGGYWMRRASGIEGTKILGLAVDPSAPRTVFAATVYSGMFKTTDNAYTWLPAGLQGELLNNVAINPFAPQTVFAGTSGNGLLRSLDGGGTWSHTQDDLNASTVVNLVFDPNQPGNYIAGTYGGGVSRSWNQGETWSDFSSGLGSRYLYGLVQNPGNKNILFALTDSAGLYRLDLSSSGGWVKVTNGVGALVVQVGETSLMEALPGSASMPYGPGHPFAPYWAIEGEAEPVVNPFDDSGKEALAGIPLLAMAFSASQPGTVYLATSGTGVYRSLDGGFSWAPAGLGGQVVTALAVHPSQPGTVYAATSTAGSIYMTTNGGTNWISLPLPGLAVYSLTFSLDDPATLYAGTSQGIRSYNPIDGWAVTGLPDLPVTAVTAHPAGLLFAGTDGHGCYLSLDSGATWAPGPLPAGITVQSISVDPHDAGRVYVNTKTHATLRMNYLDRSAWK